MLHRCASADGCSTDQQALAISELKCRILALHLGLSHSSHLGQHLTAAHGTHGPIEQLNTARAHAQVSTRLKHHTCTGLPANDALRALITPFTIIQRLSSCHGALTLTLKAEDSGRRAGWVARRRLSEGR